MRGLILLLTVLLPLTVSADSSLPFMKDMAGDRTLPRPWGLGLDFYTMDQDYDIKDLQFALPGVVVGDPSAISVTNDVQHFDIKGDVWLLPFLNVFGLVGRMSSDTVVDFSDADIQGLPPIVNGKPAILAWVNGRWIMQRPFDWSDHVNDYWDEALNVNHYNALLYSRMKTGLLTFCDDYKSEPQLYQVHDEESLKNRYRDLQLCDTSELRLENLCVEDEDNIVMSTGSSSTGPKQSSSHR